MAYLPVFLVLLDTVIITQLNCRLSYMPNLIREVTALRWDVWINLIWQFQIKYDFVKSAKETVENLKSRFTCAEYNALIIETLFILNKEFF